MEDPCLYGVEIQASEDIDNKFVMTAGNDSASPSVGRIMADASPSKACSMSQRRVEQATTPIVTALFHLTDLNNTAGSS